MTTYFFIIYERNRVLLNSQLFEQDPPTYQLIFTCGCRALCRLLKWRQQLSSLVFAEARARRGRGKRVWRKDILLQTFVFVFLTFPLYSCYLLLFAHLSLPYIQALKPHTYPVPPNTSHQSSPSVRDVGGGPIFFLPKLQTCSICHIEGLTNA